MISELTKEFRLEIANKGYETPTGKVRFPRFLRECFRKEIGDYHSDEVEITTLMIDIFNKETRAL